MTREAEQKLIKIKIVVHIDRWVIARRCRDWLVVRRSWVEGGERRGPYGGDGVQSAIE